MTSATTDAFAILLQGAKENTSLPEKWSPSNAKLKLKNGIIDWLAQNKLGWEAAMAKQLGLKFVNTLADALWYIDGNGNTLADQSLQQFQGYKEPEKHKHKQVMADSLRSKDFRAYLTACFTLSASSFMKMQRWVSVRESVLRFANDLQQYASYLDSQRVATKGNQSRLEASGEVDEITVILAKTVHLGPAARYLTLYLALQKSKPFESLCK